METKQCAKCKSQLPFGMFTKNRQNKKYGLSSYCRECMRQLRIKNRKKWNACSKRYRENNPERMRKLWNNIDPIKKSARIKTNTELKAGRITRPKYCTKCGKYGCEIQAHHLDYKKPLKINWLCRSCHALEHQLINIAEQEIC